MVGFQSSHVILKNIDSRSRMKAKLAFIEIEIEIRSCFYDDMISLYYCITDVLSYICIYSERQK